VERGVGRVDQQPRFPVSVRVQAAVAALLARAPARLRRALAGPEVVVDGQGLAVDARLLTRQARGRSVLVVDDSPEASRAALTRAALVLWAGHRPSKEVSARPVILTGGETPLRATLYEPARGGPSGLLVFFHGGGWVIGSAHVYDHVGCFLVERTGHRVLSVDYRLAPEDPFPAAVNDALAAFDAAWSRSVEWSVDPDRIVVGGDSAGATIAAVVARQTAQRGDGPVPFGQWLLYPATDFTRRYPSRDLFANGFLLTDSDIVWFQNQYLPLGTDRIDPRVSVIYGDIVPRTPPAYIATAGFDPLRDEGEAYARALRAAGVVVTATRQADLPHGFLPFLHLGPRFTEAAADTADGLAVLLA
jgi:acetyl esterase